MPHEPTLLTTLISGIVLAFLFGAIAVRLRAPALAGYLAAGVVIGPFTPGFVADQDIAAQLAELGVIFLMFGVGLHFSIGDLMAVRRIAVPGALGQIAAATVMGGALGVAMGWPLAGSALFGLALSTASTVVLLKALEERGLTATDKGRIAVGWLIVEDLVMVVALVLIPALAATAGLDAAIDDGHAGPAVAAGSPLGALALTAVKVGAFFVTMAVIGKRLIPWVLRQVAGGGSDEMFRVAVMALALGSAFGAAEIFGVSLALGAFFAGMIIADTDFAERADRDSLPLRDAFAVLFFVSVGMLFDPASVLAAPLALAAIVLIIVVGKSVVAWLIVARGLGGGAAAGVTVSASLAQIGEFSFILAEMGRAYGLIPEAARDLILAGALISILLNPLAFGAGERLLPRLEARVRPGC